MFEKEVKRKDWFNSFNEQEFYKVGSLDEKINRHILGMYKYVASASLVSSVSLFFINAGFDFTNKPLPYGLGVISIFMLMLLLALSYIVKSIHDYMSLSDLKLLFFRVCGMFGELFCSGAFRV